jgi:transposase
VNLNYTYRCYPTREQEVWLGETADQCRRWWNDLVGRQRQAHRQRVSGREDHTRAKIAALLGTKKQTGQRAAQRNRLAAELGDAEAAEAMRAADAGKLAKATGSGLEVAFAIAVVSDIRTRDTGGHLGAVYAQLVARYRRTWQQAWRTAKTLDGRRGPPRFKKRRDAMPITRQWQQDGCWIERDGKRYVNVGAFLPQRVVEGAELEVEVHRPLPPSTKIKELKLKRLAARWELTLAVEVDAADYYQARASTGKVCGIDPGRKAAATVASINGSESRVLTPGKPLARAGRRIEILQQRLDRQRRRNNPECFRADGTWIKGRRARKVSARMRLTLEQLRQTHQKIADVRKTYWGQETARLVNDYDTVYLGDWSPATPKSKGERRRERKAKFRERQEQRKRGAAASEGGRNKSDADNSLGDFRRQLAERVSRAMSAAAKKLTVIREPNTTRTCAGCGALTGPSGLEEQSIRRWTCTACGKEQDRDVASAINIARRGLETDALLVSAEPSTPQKARIPKVRRKPSRPRKHPKVSGSHAPAQVAQEQPGPLAPSQLVLDLEVSASRPEAAEEKSSVQPSPLAQAPESQSINSS